MKKKQLEKVSLGSLLTLKKGKKPKKQSPVKEKGMQPYVDIKAFETGVIDNYTDDDKCLPCNDGDLLIVCDGSRSGYVGRAIKGYTGSTLAKISAEGVDNSYLYYFIQSMYRLLNTQMKGTGTPHLNADVLRNAELVIPSIPEQKRIVNKIEELFSELDSAVETLKKTKEQLAVYRQSVLKEAFDACDKKEKITSYFEISAGLTKNSKRASFPLKMPYLRVANVYYNRLDLLEIKSIGVQESEITDKLLKKEDLLFVEGNGSKEQIGRVAIWDDSIKNCLHQNHIIKGRPLGGMLSKFALYYLISDFGRKQILKVSSSTSGLYTLSTEKVRNLNVPSCSLLKQKNIVQQIESRLSACENIERTVNEALIQADAMRQSILKKAFEGSL